MSCADLEKMRARQHARSTPHSRHGSAQVPRVMLMLEWGQDAGGDMSTVIGGGTGGGAGSSDVAHGSSSSVAPPWPTPTVLGPPDPAGALLNSSARVKGAVNEW